MTEPLDNDSIAARQARAQDDLKYLHLAQARMEPEARTAVLQAIAAGNFQEALSLVREKIDEIRAEQATQ